MRLRKCLLLNNFRILTIISGTTLLLMFYIQQRKISNSWKRINDLEQQLTTVSSDINVVRDNLVKLKQINRDNAELVDESILYLDSAALNLGHEVTSVESVSDVCPEEYLGVVDWPYHYNNWRQCSPGDSPAQLITIIFTAYTMSQAITL